MKKNVLGRGLSALISDPAEETGKAMAELDIDLIYPNPHQPRRDLTEESLSDLVASIRESGILQPILVNKDGKRYQLVAGERRWRAGQLAGLKKIPAIIRSFSERETLEVALIENIQRNNLNPIEEARAYEVLVQEFDLRQEEIAKRMGKDRTSITNTIRLLQLPKTIQDDIAAGEISVGHAKVLLGVSSYDLLKSLAQRIKTEQLSVRKTEDLVKAARDQKKEAPGKAAENKPDVHVRAAQETLIKKLGTKVKIVKNGASGRIEIFFFSEDELDRLYTMLTQPGKA